MSWWLRSLLEGDAFFALAVKLGVQAPSRRQTCRGMSASATSGIRMATQSEWEPGWKRSRANKSSKEFAWLNSCWAIVLTLL